MNERLHSSTSGQVPASHAVGPDVLVVDFANIIAHLCEAEELYIHKAI